MSLVRSVRIDPSTKAPKGTRCGLVKRSQSRSLKKAQTEGSVCGSVSTVDTSDASVISDAEIASLSVSPDRGSVLRRISVESSLSYADLQELKEDYDALDSNGDGKVCEDDITVFVEACGLGQLKAKDLRRMIRRMDPDGRGYYDFVRFVEVMAQEKARRTPEDEIRDAFKFFDKKGTGKISVFDFCTFMNQLENQVSWQDAKQMLVDAGFESKRFLTQRDFEILMTQVTMPHMNLTEAEDQKLRRVSVEIDRPLQEVASYRNVYDSFDRNGNGAICLREMAEYLESRGFGKLDEEHIKQMFEQADLDSNDRITFDEFVKVFCVAPELTIDDTMQFFDQGGNGKVSIMEFTDILNRYCEFLDEPLDIEDVKIMLVDAGFDINTKWLTPEELHSLLSSGSDSESE